VERKCQRRYNRALIRPNKEHTLQAQLVALGGDVIFINLQIVPRCLG
jgi:hypothetical protein